MAIFHQSAHQLSPQIKLFPVRFNDLHFFNVTFDEAEFGFAELDQSFGGFSFIALLPVVLIGILLSLLLIFLKLRSLRADREQLERLEYVYRVLEYVDQVAANPYDDPELVRTIQSVLLPDEDEEHAFLQSKKTSYFAHEYRHNPKTESCCELDENSEARIRVVHELEHNHLV